MEKLMCQIRFQEVIQLNNNGFILDRSMLDLIITSWSVVISDEIKSKLEDHFQISEDCRSAVLDGNHYSFTSRQAQVVELLLEAYQQKTMELSQEYIIDRIGSESDTLTLRDIFRHSKAWNTLIIPGSRRGMYRLNI
jgi:hypothetical protein